MFSQCNCLSVSACLSVSLSSLSLQTLSVSYWCVVKLRYAAQAFFANISIENYDLGTLQALTAVLPNDTEFSASVANIQNVWMAVKQTVESPDVEAFPYLATGAMERILSLHHNDTHHAGGPGGENARGMDSDVALQASFVGGRAGMQTAVRINSARR